MRFQHSAHTTASRDRRYAFGPRQRSISRSAVGAIGYLTIMDHVVLLTATVLPSAFFKLAVTSADDRLAQYESAIARWVELGDRLNFRVVVVENSGVGRERLQASLGSNGSNHLLISKDSAARPGEGRGNGEARLLDLASSWLRDLADGDLVTKCTGRLFVPNFSDAVRVNEFGIQAAMTSTFGAVDSRMFTVPAMVLRRHLSRMAQDIEEGQGVYFEHVLRARLLLALSEGVPWVGWRSLPRFVGVQGSSGRSYTSIIGSVKHQLRSIHRAVARCYPYTL